MHTYNTPGCEFDALLHEGVRNHIHRVVALHGEKYRLGTVMACLVLPQVNSLHHPRWEWETNTNIKHV